VHVIGAHDALVGHDVLVDGIETEGGAVNGFFAADATTAMRQLYFIVQLMLMNPTDVGAAASLYGQHHAALLAVCENREMLDGLAAIDEMVGGNRYFEALKRIRALFPLEQAILAGAATESPFKAA